MIKLRDNADFNGATLIVMSTLMRNESADVSKISALTGITVEKILMALHMSETCGLINHLQIRLIDDKTIALGYVTRVGWKEVKRRELNDSKVNSVLNITLLPFRAFSYGAQLMMGLGKRSFSNKLSMTATQNSE